MIIKPKARGYICITAHPEGCAQNVQEQIDFVKKQGPVVGPKKVLIIGASTGFGLASRIVSAFGAGAATIGVFFEKPGSENRTATAGWYNTAAFERKALEAGIYSKSINGDAFSDEIKKKTIAVIKEDLGQVDLVIYSLASPRRIHPVTGENLSSAIKPIGKPFTNKAVDFYTGKISEVTIEPATEEEIRHTVGVMGGEDWQMWIQALQEADALSNGAITIAYSYIGPEITNPIYRGGTIGRAKDHLEASAKTLMGSLNKIGGKAFVSVDKALVTQSSAAIPVVPLYISLLYKVMKEKGIHEGCVDQILRLFKERLYSEELPLDSSGRIRVDDLEMREDVQLEVSKLWEKIDTENIDELSDIKGYREEFFKLFGFGFENIDYDKDIVPNISIPNII